MSTQNKPLFIRLRPDTRELLDRAAVHQSRSRASLIDSLVREALAAKYSDVEVRLDHLLGVPK